LKRGGGEISSALSGRGGLLSSDEIAQNILKEVIVMRNYEIIVVNSDGVEVNRRSVGFEEFEEIKSNLFENHQVEEDFTIGGLHRNELWIKDSVI